MKKINVLYRVLIFVSVVITACGNNNNNASGDATINAAPTAPVYVNLKPERFDQLENIFQNENWLMVNSNDSSYFYCSRLGKTYFKVYRYRMFKGDSVDTRISEMQLTTDTITWKALADTTAIYLKDLTPNEAVWANRTNNQFYIFNKIDSNNIRITYPDGSAKNLLKTPTISSFLVRSKYDYLHGTKLALSTGK